MHARVTRLTAMIALVSVLAMPGSTLAADPGATGRPADVAWWQAHLAHMAAMPGAVGSHVGDCIAAHGSMAGQLGPNGAMAEMMAGGMMR
jgi:hypothetical protein